MAEIAPDHLLTSADFSGFFAEVHGYRPFPWQAELVKRVTEHGWPALIDVPTGLGKTAVLDAAVFLSALRSEHARRRIFLVVDRRLIVDQAHDEASALSSALRNAMPGTLCSLVRDRLAVPGDDDTAAVLDVTRMRGGANWSWRWIERPDRHAIITGTVDQIGSRLLFRGYGVSEKLRPIDAAMTGTDSLIIVDEAHLSDPFLTTLQDALALDAGRLGRKPLVVAMSASPEAGNGNVHGIGAADVQHEVAGQRLRAAKTLHPVTVTATTATAASATADALAYWAKQLGGPGKVTAVVANTVRMARDTFELLRHQASDPRSCVLLTGRVRPIDREYLLASWYPRIKSRASRDPEAELYVVATQTIEAGADIDVDALVTQASSLPALVQRLGRLNRLGTRDSSQAIVVHTDKLADPVYGDAAEQAWTWLTSLTSPVTRKAGRAGVDLAPGLDVSPAALRGLTDGLPDHLRRSMQGPSPYVPLVSRLTLDAWARTSPAPHPDAPVAPFLHGIGIGEPTVSLVWRDDLRADDWLASAELIPPSTDEAIELPVSSARRWLEHASAARVGQPSLPPAEDAASDLESQQAAEATNAPGYRTAGPEVLRYRGAGDCQMAGIRDIGPGDMIIIPSAWGGCDRYGWHPESAAAVTDIADFTGTRRRRPPAIRIGPVFLKAIAALAPDLTEQASGLIATAVNDIVAEQAEDRKYSGLIRDMIGDQVPRLPHELVLNRLAEAGRLTAVGQDDETGHAGREVAGLFAAAAAAWNEDDSAAGSSGSPRKLTLAGHQAATGRRAREFAVNLGLDEALVQAVDRAARLHDEGKQDPRFQAMLHGGTRLRALAEPEPLAKSGIDPADRAALRRAASLSGYPPNMRHEALSAQIAAARLDHAPDGDLDKDLVVHLVAAHHGCSRPLLPPIADDHPEKIPVPMGNGVTVEFDSSDTVDWSAPDRFRQLCHEYGFWGLALLESVVRLADIWCSARSEASDDHC